MVLPHLFCFESVLFRRELSLVMLGILMVSKFHQITRLILMIYVVPGFAQ